MHAGGDTDRLISALLDLVDRASARFPTLQAQLVEMSARFGDPTGPLFDRLRSGLTEAFADPAIAGEVLQEFDAWVRLMLTEEGRNSQPLALAIRAVLDELGQVLADVQTGESSLDASFEKHITPLLHMAGNAIVNTLLGEND